MAGDDWASNSVLILKYKALAYITHENCLLVFEFFWARLLDGVPALIADHGKLLVARIESLSRES